MEDRIDQSTGTQNNINGISERSFNKLNDEQKSVVLSKQAELNSKTIDGGWFGKVFGTNTKNSSIHIALVLCVILLLFCGVDMVHSLMNDCPISGDIWNSVLPIITLSLGYIFGKGKSE